MQKYNSRDEVPEKYKWDLSGFFKDEEDFNDSLNKTTKLIIDLKNYVGCTKDANKLFDFLEKETESVALWQDLYVYAHLVNDQELGNSLSIERKNKAEKLGSAFEENTSFFAPELLKLTKEEYDELFINNDKLLKFKADLDRIYRNKGHILTESEEVIVAQLVNAMNHYDDMSSTLLNSEHDYGKVKLDNGTVEVIASNNYSKLMKNKNVDIRKKVYNSYNTKIDQYSNTSASLLDSYVNMNNTLAKIYHFNSSWDKNLFGLNLDNKVFDTLVKTTECNLDSLQKYYKLKKKVLNLDVIHSYDLNLEMNANDKEYSIEEALEVITKALTPLGSEYLTRFKKIIDRRYIDYCQYRGKCSGGYSFSTLKQDSRILMSFNNNLVSVSTIAHEGGHNVHHQFVKDNNDLQYREVSSIVAEVASLTNECLLSNYLAKNGETKEEKLAGLANIMEVIVSNLYGSVREGKMEQDMYTRVLNGDTLTKDYLDELAYKSVEKYSGKSVKISKEVKNSWVTRSHYYMNFYLYSYAICISVATNVASKILSGDKNMLENYMRFLKVGSDKWPSDAFAILGIDLEEKNVYENAIKYFDSIILEYESIYNSEEVK